MHEGTEAWGVNGVNTMNEAHSNVRPEQVIIEARNLHLYYGSFHALKDINMDIEERSVTALIGPSGCGKSTFLRTSQPHERHDQGRPHRGEVRLRQVDIYRKCMMWKSCGRKSAWCFNSPTRFPKAFTTMSLMDRTFTAFATRKVLDEIVERSLRQAALWDEVKDNLKRPAYGLSGGQQQRLCIARALAVNPEILLMDEPTSALDPISTAKIEDLVRELKNTYTIVIVTHNMQQAARISDRTAFFLNGELIEYDRTERIFTNPRDQRTEDYVTGRFG